MEIIEELIGNILTMWKAKAVNEEWLGMEE